MRVLIVGAGGREHALAWSLAASPLLTKLWVAPGNPGTAGLAENVPILATDVAALTHFAHDNAVDLVVPGPEAVVAERALLGDAHVRGRVLVADPAVDHPERAGRDAVAAAVADLVLHDDGAELGAEQ